MKGVNNLSSYELIWRLIVLLLLSNNDLEDSQKTLDKRKASQGGLDNRFILCKKKTSLHFTLLNISYIGCFGKLLGEVLQKINDAAKFSLCCYTIGLLALI